MSALSESMNFEALRSLAFGSIGSAYTIIGSASSNPVRILIINNYTNATLIFSLDGVTDQFALAAGNSLTLDICANKTQKQGFYLDHGKAVYVKYASAAPTLGDVYFSTGYGENRNAL